MTKSSLLSIFLFFSIHCFSQVDVNINQLEIVDFKKVESDITILPEENLVHGTVLYTFDLLKNADSMYLDARNMTFTEVNLNGKPVKHTNTGSKLWIKDLPKSSKDHLLKLNYQAKPKQAMYFINWDVAEDESMKKQVWTQGQGKYTSHWLPSFDDMNEKAEFDQVISFEPGFEVIANGELKKKEILGDSLVKWHYNMEKPMSSYLLAIAIGKYNKFEALSDSGIPMSFYYREKDSSRVKPTYRHSKKMFDFLENRIGVSYPWQNYKQVPVQDFLYAGMENTGLTIFSESLQTDSIGFKDRNYVNVNAHELAHQWFGNLITEASGEHHWLQEGFATYYALLAEREIFGEDYYYWKLFQTAEQLKDLSDRGKGERLVNSKASSLTFYQKGAWALHILNEKVGDSAFNLGVKNYLEKYQFKNVTTQDFIHEIEKASGQDLSTYVENWLVQSAFKANQALNSLKESEFISDYLEVARFRDHALNNKSDYLKKALDFPVNDYIGQEVVFQLAGNKTPEAIELYKKAFATNNSLVRQAIALSLDKIPSELRSNYESLLIDESYLTKEAALLNLWMQFPDARSEYLLKTKGIEGFYNKNVETLWLALSIATPAFNDEERKLNYEKLSAYTSPKNPMEIRENAFSYLYQLNMFSDQNLKDLLQGSQHFNYRFRDFCRKLLDKLLQDEAIHEKYVALSESLPENLLAFLNKKLNK